MLQQIARRWPLLIACLFAGYSILLLLNAVQARDQLRAATDTRLSADSRRRAAAVADFVAKRRTAAREISSVHELDNYLISRALGMSPRYGLDAMLAAVDECFRQQVIPAQASEGVNLKRVAFIDPQGEVLADSTPGEPVIHLPRPQEGEARVLIDSARGRIVVAAPVIFKGEYAGMLVTDSLLSDLYRHLLQVEQGNHYHETLLTADGQEVPTPDGKTVFAASLVPALLKLPDDRPVPLDGIAPGSIGIRTAVPGQPLVLLTSMAWGDVYSPLASQLFFYSAAGFPVILLLAALLLEQQRQRARRAESEADSAHSRGRELQGENVALAAEIARREALETELEQHREHLEELVAERTAELDSLFRALPDLYFRVARDGSILDFRCGRDADLYLPPEAFLGRRVQEILPENVAAKFREAIGQLERGMPAAFEYWLPMPSGQQWYEARLVGLSGEQSLVVIRNITERRQVEATREANRQEAERLARVKSEFLANMSHEIRTPLNGVLGMAEIGYRQSEGRDKARRQFRQIIESGNLLLGIINDILDYSKIEAGKLRIERLPIDLDDLLAQVLKVLAGRAQEKGLALTLRKSPDLPPRCLGDPLRLSQVLMNLLANVVKFTERGSIELEVRRDGDRLLFSVSDTGIGMTPEQVGRLFGAFEQIDGGITRKFGGTGLGLAISHRLVELMGGAFAVSSTPGVGSQFRFDLPLVAASPATAAPPEHAPAAWRGGTRLAGMRVLVAEDIPVNQIVISTLLEEEGAVAVIVGDGRAALELVARDGGEAFDVALMDIQMPEMDGYTATRQLRELAPGLPVIGQTAHALAEDRERCLAAGMVAYLAKPLRLEAVVEVLLAYARPSPRWRPDAAPPAASGA